MTDIYDIKDIILGAPIGLIDTLFVTIILVLLYFFLFRKRSLKNSIRIETIITEDIDYKKIINSLKHNNLDTQSLLKEISRIFRGFLQDKLKYENFSNLTLKEILEKQIEVYHIDILQDIYYKEYRGEELDIEERNKLYKKVKNIINNYDL